MKKKNKIAFCSTRLSVVVLFFLFAFNSCIKEPATEYGAVSNLSANLAVTLNSRADGETTESGDVNKNEDLVKRVRVLVIGASGSYWAGRVTCNETFTIVGDALTVNAKSRAGNSDIYVIANETEQLANLLSKVTTQSEFENAVLNFTPLAQDLVAYDDLPMMAKETRVLSAEVASNEITAQLDRLYAKVRIKLKAGIDAGVDYNGKVTLSSVQVVGLPKYSFLVKKSYPESGGFQDGTIIHKSVLIEQDLTEPIELYIPEYMIGLNSNKCQLVINGVKTGTTSLCVYRINLGEDPKNVTPDYNINRNTIYDITGTVKGYGNADVEVLLNVLKWNGVSIKGEVGRYFTLDKTQGEDIVFGGGTSQFNVLTTEDWGASIVEGVATIDNTSGTKTSPINITLLPNLNLFKNIVKVVVTTSAVGIRPTNRIEYTVEQQPSLFNLVAENIEGSGTNTLSPKLNYDVATFTYEIPVTVNWSASQVGSFFTADNMTGNKQMVTLTLSRNSSDFQRTGKVVITTNDDVVTPAQSATINITQYGLLQDWVTGHVAYKTNEGIPDTDFNTSNDGAYNTFGKGKTTDFPATNKCYNLNRNYLGREPQNVGEMIWFQPAAGQAESIINNYVSLTDVQKNSRGPFAGFVLDQAKIPGHHVITSTSFSNSEVWVMNPNRNGTIETMLKVPTTASGYYNRCVRLATQAEKNNLAKGIYITTK